MTYLCTIFITLAFVYLYDIKGYTAYNKAAYRFLLLIAISIAGFRYLIGGDSLRYMRLFDVYPQLSDSIYDFFSYTLFDPLWMFLNAVVKTIFDDFTFFQIVHAVIFNAIVFHFFKKYTSYKFTAAFFYFIFFYIYFNTEILRESLAVACFMMSVKYFINKKWIRYYLIATAAIMLHSSAIVIFMFPFLRMKYSPFKVVIILFTIIIVFVLLNPILESLLINPIMQVRFDIYMEQGTSIFGRIRQLILLIIFPMLMIYINDNLLNKHNPVYGKFYMVYFFVASISIGNTDIGFRLLNYLMLLRISFFVLFTYNVLTSLCFRPVSIPLFIILVIMPISMEYLIYISDTSHIQHNTKRYFRWYPYTTVFYKNNKYQQKITNNRELYIDNVEEYQHDYYK